MNQWWRLSAAPRSAPRQARPSPPVTAAAMTSLSPQLRAGDATLPQPNQRRQRGGRGCREPPGLDGGAKVHGVAGVGGVHGDASAASAGPSPGSPRSAGSDAAGMKRVVLHPR